MTPCHSETAQPSGSTRKVPASSTTSTPAPFEIDAKDLAGEAEYRRLVGGAVADRERASALGQAIDDPAKAGGEPL